MLGLGYVTVRVRVWVGFRVTLKVTGVFSQVKYFDSLTNLNSKLISERNKNYAPLFCLTKTSA